MGTTTHFSPVHQLKRFKLSLLIDITHYYYTVQCNGHSIFYKTYAHTYTQTPAREYIFYK